MLRTTVSGRRSWRRQLGSFLYGPAALGGYWLLVALIALCLQALHARGRLAQYAIVTMLVLSLLAILGAVSGPKAIIPYMLFCAIGLIGSVVLVPANRIGKPSMLRSVAAAGVGAAGIGLGVVGLIQGHLLLVAAVIAFAVGVTFVRAIGSVLLNGDLRYLLGAALEAVPDILPDIMTEMLASILERKSRFELALGSQLVVFGALGIGTGVLSITTRAPILRGELLLSGVAFISIGVAVAGAGLTFLVGRWLMCILVVVGAWVVFAGFGVAFIVAGRLLVGLALFIAWPFLLAGMKANIEETSEATESVAGWPGGISPPGSHRTERESLPSLRSSHLEAVPEVGHPGPVSE